MKIKISKNQYDKLKDKIQLAIDFPKEIVVRFGGFKPDDYYQPTFVYLDEMPVDDIFKLKELKDKNKDVTVKLNNIYTKEEFDFPLEITIIAFLPGIFCVCRFNWISVICFTVIKSSCIR